jgi:gamma-glutamyl-gamma-aminobutyrate hydrolase PuuD
MERAHPQILQKIASTFDIDADNEKALVEAINIFKKTFNAG